MTPTDTDVIEAMDMFGGGFVKALAAAWRAADASNRARLKSAFPEYWAYYVGVALTQTAEAQ